MYNRPKPGETEDDILQMQEAYFNNKKAGKVESAAKVLDCREIASPPGESGLSSEKSNFKLSKYARSKGLKKVTFNNAVRNDNLVGDIVERAYNNSVDNEKECKLDQNKHDDVNFPKPSPEVLGEICERTVSAQRSFSPNSDLPCTGFPCVKLRNKTIKPGAMSIFAQQVDAEILLPRLSGENNITQLEESITVNKKRIYNSLPDQSFILTGVEAEKIHKENVTVLKELSEDLILEEKRRLESTMDPTLIDFIRRKRQKININSDAGRMETIEESNSSVEEACTTISTESKESFCDMPSSMWDNDVLCHPDLEHWLNFDNFEKEKLRWMEAMNTSTSKPSNKEYEARFNLKGWLLPYTLEYTEESKILFHHGDEPYRPGYSIKELFDLSRSIVIQQKVIALNTLAGILEYYNIGAYQDVMILPITKIFFVLRFALDDNRLLILEPSLRALRNLFCNRIDEACLDNLFFTDKRVPNLQKDKSEIHEIDSDQSELKDFHLAEIDLVTGALRTDILVRIRYILNVLKPNFNCVQYCLQILTRFTRDSDEVVTQILHQEDFVANILGNFVPFSSSKLEFNPNVVYGRPTLAALKFFRVLACHSREVAKLLVEKYYCMKSITAYLNVTAETTHALKVQIEAMNLWSVLILRDLGTSEFEEMISVLLFSVDKHVKGTDLHLSPAIMLAHASSLISMISNAMQCESITKRRLKEIKLFFILLGDGLRKWIAQISVVTNCTNRHLLLPSTVLMCLGNSFSQFKSFQPDDSISIALTTFCLSNSFQEIIRHVVKCSNLLSNLSVSTNIPNLYDLGSSLLSSTQVALPAVSIQSPMCFMASLLLYVKSAKISTCGLILLDSLKDYTMKIISEKSLSLQDNWFTRIEIRLLLNFIQMSQTLNLNDTQKDTVYILSHKIIYLLSAEHLNGLKAIFTQIIFNKDWFTMDRILKNLTLTLVKNTTSELQSICSFYYKTLNFDKRIENDELKLFWKSYILPKDWMYLPIVALYSKSQEIQDENRIDTSVLDDKITTIKYTLQWVIFSETYFPEQMCDINLTDRFCRIMCVFLCDSSLFLDNCIKELLGHCLGILYKLEKKFGFNFEDKLEGMNNFEDFFKQFVDHFQAVSYGDNNFASCLLVPLVQKHDIKWKKIIWSEYASALRALDCPEELLCYSFNEYLHPEERDVSLLKCYQRALQNNLVRPGTLTYRIASHHLEKAKLREGSS